jgi:hypothetical protein
VFKKSADRLLAEARAYERRGDELREAAASIGAPAARRRNIAPAMRAYSDCMDLLFKIPESERPADWPEFAARLKEKHVELQQLSRELFPNAGI